MIDLFTSCSIIDEHELNCSDHLPIIAHLNTGNLLFKRTQFVRVKYNWSKFTANEIAQKYGSTVASALQKTVLPRRDISPNDIDTFYKSLISNIQEASSSTRPKCHYKKHIKPKWSQEVAPYHAAMRATRITWINAGLPRGSNNPVFKDFKDAKRILRKNLRNLYISLENEFFNDIDKSAETDLHLFWNLLNCHKARKNRVCEFTVGETINREPHAIVKAWADYFSDLYTPKNLARFDDEHKLFVENSLKVMTTCSYSNKKNVLDDDIALHEVIEAIKSLKCKKSCGLDLVSNEHLIHGGAALFEHLTCLFNLFMHNEHIPSEVKCGVIITIPIIRAKTAKPPQQLQRNHIVTLYI